MSAPDPFCGQLTLLPSGDLFLPMSLHPPSRLQSVLPVLEAWETDVLEQLLGHYTQSCAGLCCRNQTFLRCHAERGAGLVADGQAGLRGFVGGFSSLLSVPVVEH